ncbi:MAG: OmpA family protein [Prosthecobacter sp.]|nr:OmpA family protein [Prosthecobacter sp.]
MRHPTPPNMHPARLLLLSTLPAVMVGCSWLPLPHALSPQPEPTVVYALGTREGFRSPLQEGNLRPACPALEFSGTTFRLSGAHRRTLEALAASWQEKKPRYLIAGYCQTGLPEDYARSLSERRAQAVRQHLIEHGVEAANLQTVGFGHDSTPSAPTSSVVVIYRQ